MKYFMRSFPVVFMAVVFLSVCAKSQDQSKLEVKVRGHEHDQITFRERNSFSLYLRIVDTTGYPVEGIKKDAVTLRKDGGNVRVIDVLRLHDLAGISARVVLVLDNSNSVEHSVDTMLQSLDLFLKELGSGTEIALVMFEEERDWLQRNPVSLEGKELNLAVLDFTADKKLVRTRAANWYKDHRTQRTYLRDAVRYAHFLLSESPLDIPLSMVIMSDGEDVGSQFTLDEVLASYPKGTEVYMIDYSRGELKVETLKKIEKTTNGKWYVVEKPQELVDLFGKISHQLSLYVVIYKSPYSLESHVLPYLFFDHNSSAFRPEYHRFSNYQEARRFDESSFPSVLGLYYDVLNVVGSRLLVNPKATVTITGTNSGEAEEKDNLGLSKQRANAVKDYLGSVWRIAPGRMTVEARNLPASPSSGSIAAGRAENRRVEITSNDPRILKQVISNRFVTDVQSAGMTTEIFALQLFDFESTEVGSINRGILHEVASNYKGVNGGKIQAIGYTDNIGDSLYNTNLAGQRASNACKVLKEDGVPASAVEFSSVGPKNPRFDNANPEGRFFNRSVVVRLSYPQ